jgi:isoquinoline 1-oxidoreductase beta subunit
MSKQTPQTPKKDGARRWRITRRGFLIGVGAAAGTVALGVTFGLPALRLQVAGMLENATIPSNAPKEPSVWFEILTDSRVRLFVTKAEMGQGVHTALAQFAAEELEIGLNDLEVVQATTSQAFRDASGTSGSGSVSGMSEPLRQAAATLREMLKTQAATQLNQPVTALKIVERGVQVGDDAGRRVEFAALAATQRQWMQQIPKEPVALKKPAEFKIIGAPVSRVDIPAKVTGRAIYGYDARAEGMLYGAVLRPPTLGATLKSVDTTDAEKVEGVVRVVREGEFVGAVARTRAAAQTAIAAMQAQWNESGKPLQQADIDAIITVGPDAGVPIQRVGDAASVLSGQAAGVLSAEYRTPMAIQTPMEPQAGLADVRADKATIWTSTQGPESVRRSVAAATGLEQDKVEVITTYLGGGFGRKIDIEAATEAAILSKAIGAPVHVGWTRTEELRYGYVRPSTHHVMRAQLGADGRIAAFEHRQASGDVIFALLPKTAANVAGGILGADFGATRGSMLRYAVPNVSTIVWRRPLPVRTGPWRGLGALPNAFALESFIDELAAAAGVDPLEFRLRHLPDDEWGKRMGAVLRAAADASSWGSAPPSGRARGIACATDVDTVVAQVAEVSVDGNGRIRVHRVTAAMDCGMVVNPDGARAQVEGNVMWGVGSTLLEEARVEDGRFAAGNFDGYPLLTMKDAPIVDAILVKSDEKIRGVGEPAIAPVAAAIGNAVFALTGKRLRQLPFTPERVNAA